jgi:hypothetical protein
MLRSRLGQILMPHWPDARIVIAVVVIGLASFGFMPI